MRKKLMLFAVTTILPAAWAWAKQRRTVQHAR
jgi:hypothetical protein